MTEIKNLTTTAINNPGSPSDELQATPFFQARLRYTTPTQQDWKGVDIQKSQCPTTELVKRLLKLYHCLNAGRMDTLFCCMAIPGKGNIARLKIIDRETLDGSLKGLEIIEERIAEYEEAIRSLDSISSGFLFEAEPAKAKQIKEILKSLEVNKNVDASEPHEVKHKEYT